MQCVCVCVCVWLLVLLLLFVCFFACLLVCWLIGWLVRSFVCFLGWAGWRDRGCYFVLFFVSRSHGYPHAAAHDNIFFNVVLLLLLLRQRVMTQPKQRPKRMFRPLFSQEIRRLPSVHRIGVLPPGQIQFTTTETGAEKYFSLAMPEKLPWEYVPLDSLSCPVKPRKRSMKMAWRLSLAGAPNFCQRCHGSVTSV